MVNLEIVTSLNSLKTQKRYSERKVYIEKRRMKFQDNMKEISRGTKNTASALNK